MKVQHKIFFVSAFVCIAFGANAQISNESVDIIKSFDVQLLESFKLDVSPALPPLDTSTKAQTYQVPAHPLNVSYEAPQLRPIGMKTVAPPDPFRGFGKLGAGMPNQFWGEGGYYFGNPENFDGTVWARHHSGNNDKNQENQRFINNDIKGNATFYLENNLAVGANLGYSFDRLHYFGYDNNEFSLDEEAVRQKYNTLDVGATFHNTAANPTDLTFWIKPRFYNLKDNFSNSENGFVFDAGANKWFAEKHNLRVNLHAESAKFEDTLSQKLNNLGIQGSYTYHADVFRVKGGVKLMNSGDDIHFFPDVEATLAIFKEGFQLFGGVTGDLRQNNMRTLTEYSPWLNMRGDSIRNTKHFDYFAGIKGNLGFVEYLGQVKVADANQLALFQTSFRDVNGVPAITQFRTLYDDANIISIQGSASLTLLGNLNIVGSFSQNIYTLDVEDKAWGLPSTEGNFGAVYKMLENKLSLSSNLYVADDIPFRNENGDVSNTNSLFDLNFGGQFYFTENIGVFAEFNNVLNNKRERWLNYPMFGTNFLAGVQARF
ncbi:MAG: hypothetical protein SFV52_06080 [Saprospiraceae bacterium]|nr:hypothetical protein [Saprospiraceae bacterium]